MRPGTFARLVASHLGWCDHWRRLVEAYPQPRDAADAMALSLGWGWLVEWEMDAPEVYAAIKPKGVG